MKDTIKWFGIIAIVAVMGFALVACGDNGDPSSSSGSIPSALVGSWGGDAENPALVINADGSGKIGGTSFEKGAFTVADGRITHTMTAGGAEVSGSVKYEITGGKLKLSDPQGTVKVHGRH